MYADELRQRWAEQDKRRQEREPLVAPAARTLQEQLLREYRGRGDGWGACVGIEALMIELAISYWVDESSPGAMGDFTFGYATVCEECGRSIDDEPALRVYRLAGGDPA